jgi:hypothetical protein
MLLEISTRSSFGRRKKGDVCALHIWIGTRGMVTGRRRAYCLLLCLEDIENFDLFPSIRRHTLWGSSARQLESRTAIMIIGW